MNAGILFKSGRFKTGRSPGARKVIVVALIVILSGTVGCGKGAAGDNPPDPAAPVKTGVSEAN
jgi:hypothetical protein